MSCFVGHPVCLSSQPLLHLSKYKSEDQEIYFEDLYISISQIIMHSGIIVLSEIIYCAVKWLKFTSEILILR